MKTGTKATKRREIEEAARGLVARREALPKDDHKGREAVNREIEVLLRARAD